MKPNASIMNFNNPFYESQSYPCPLSAGIKFFKQSEQLMLMTRIDAGAIILNKQHRLISVFIENRTNFNPGTGLISHKLNCIVNQILVQLDESLRMPVNNNGGA